MAAAGRGKDLYEGIVTSGAVDSRAHAKVAMLGAMYGATTGESGRLMPRLGREYPRAIHRLGHPRPRCRKSYGNRHSRSAESGLGHVKVRRRS